MSILTLKLPKELERELSRTAARRGVSKSQLAREALTSYLRRPEQKDTPFVSALDLVGDLAGSIRRSPRGISTDPRFMEDFGQS